MAAIACIFGKIISLMANYARNIVIRIQLKDFRVIESSGFQFALIMTAAALSADFLMQTIVRFLVTDSNFGFRSNLSRPTLATGEPNVQ